MSDRADAHAHLFYPGYVAELPETCRRSQPSELNLYEALGEKYAVRGLLAIGYEGLPFAAGNNQYICELARSRSWIHPTAFVHDLERLDVGKLQCWRENRFVGLSLYLLDEPQVSTLKFVADDVWNWLEEHLWLISVNSRGAHWSAWGPILERFPHLRVLISHLGLPARVSRAPSRELARSCLTEVVSLAAFPGVRIKLSGFYAIAQPGHAYPHLAAWPYVISIIEVFGSNRLLWGSDFSPSLEHLSFQQTFSLFDEMPFLTNADREKILGGNLLGLLDEVR